jgi:4-hydroxy-tetrahydrodipicolinate reductase
LSLSRIEVRYKFVFSQGENSFSSNHILKSKLTGETMAEEIKVVVCGAAGRMGQEVCRAVAQDNQLLLVGAVDPAAVGRSVKEVAGLKEYGDLVIMSNLKDFLAEKGADVMVDFTLATAAKENIMTALRHNVHAVVGTTGLSEADLAQIKQVAEESQANVFIAPNFAIGAVLMMKFAEIAASFMDFVEIVELHHEKKKDAPSGTALQTAAKIVTKKVPQTIEGDDISRGQNYKGVRIHSVRLPGLVAHQEVIFGGQGQTLTIKHDSIDRTSFMPGVLKAIKAVSDLRGLTIGLDRLLGL